MSNTSKPIFYYESTATVHLISRTTTKWYEYDFIAKEGLDTGIGMGPWSLKNWKTSIAPARKPSHFGKWLKWSSSIFLNLQVRAVSNRAWSNGKWPGRQKLLWFSRPQLLNYDCGYSIKSPPKNRPSTSSEIWKIMEIWSSSFPLLMGFLNSG